MFWLLLGCNRSHSEPCGTAEVQTCVTINIITINIIIISSSSNHLLHGVSALPCSGALTIRLNMILDPDLTLCFNDLKTFDVWESALRLLLAMINPPATSAAKPALAGASDQRLSAWMVQHGLVMAALGVPTGSLGPLQQEQLQGPPLAAVPAGGTKGGSLSFTSRPWGSGRASVGDPSNQRLRQAQDWAARGTRLVERHLLAAQQPPGVEQQLQTGHVTHPQREAAGRHGGEGDLGSQVCAVPRSSSSQEAGAEERRQRRLSAPQVLIHAHQVVDGSNGSSNSSSSNGQGGGGAQKWVDGGNQLSSSDVAVIRALLSKPLDPKMQSSPSPPPASQHQLACNSPSRHRSALRFVTGAADLVGQHQQSAVQAAALRVFQQRPGSARKQHQAPPAAHELLNQLGRELQLRAAVAASSGSPAAEVDGGTAERAGVTSKTDLSDYGSPAPGSPTAAATATARPPSPWGAAGGTGLGGEAERAGLGLVDCSTPVVGSPTAAAAMARAASPGGVSVIGSSGDWVTERGGLFGGSWRGKPSSGGVPAKAVALMGEGLDAGGSPRMPAGLKGASSYETAGSGPLLKAGIPRGSSGGWGGISSSGEGSGGGQGPGTGGVHSTEQGSSCLASPRGMPGAPPPSGRGSLDTAHGKAGSAGQDGGSSCLVSPRGMLGGPPPSSRGSLDAAYGRAGSSGRGSLDTAHGQVASSGRGSLDTPRAAQLQHAYLPLPESFAAVQAAVEGASSPTGRSQIPMRSSSGGEESGRGQQVVGGPLARDGSVASSQGTAISFVVVPFIGAAGGEAGSLAGSRQQEVAGGAVNAAGCGVGAAALLERRNAAQQSPGAASSSIDIEFAPQGRWGRAAPAAFSRSAKSMTVKFQPEADSAVLAAERAAAGTIHAATATAGQGGQTQLAAYNADSADEFCPTNRSSITLGSFSAASLYDTSFTAHTSRDASFTSGTLSPTAGRDSAAAAAMCGSGSAAMIGLLPSPTGRQQGSGWKGSVSASTGGHSFKRASSSQLGSFHNQQGRASLNGGHAPSEPWTRASSLSWATTWEYDDGLSSRSESFMQQQQQQQSRNLQDLDSPGRPSGGGDEAPSSFDPSSLQQPLSLSWSLHSPQQQQQLQQRQPLIVQLLQQARDSAQPPSLRSAAAALLQSGTGSGGMTSQVMQHHRRLPLLRSSSGGAMLPPLPPQLHSPTAERRQAVRRGGGALAGTRSASFVSPQQVAILPALLEADASEDGEEGAAAFAEQQRQQQQQQQEVDGQLAPHKQQGQEQQQAAHGQAEAAAYGTEAGRVDALGHAADKAGAGSVADAAGLRPAGAPAEAAAATISSSAPGHALPPVATRAPQHALGLPRSGSGACSGDRAPPARQLSMASAYQQAVNGGGMAQHAAGMARHGPFGLSSLQRGDSAVVLGTPGSGAYGLSAVGAARDGSPRHLQLKLPMHRRASSAHSFYVDGSGQWSAGGCLAVVGKRVLYLSTDCQMAPLMSFWL